MDSFSMFEKWSVFLLELFFVLSSKALPFPDRKWSVLLSLICGPFKAYLRICRGTPDHRKADGGNGLATTSFTTSEPEGCAHCFPEAHPRSGP